MSNDDRNDRGSNTDPLGDSWLSADNAEDPTASQAPLDRELHTFLQRAVPASQVGYWEAIDASLATAEQHQGDEGHSNSVDTSGAVVRPMVMDTSTTSSKSPRFFFAAAAALLLLVGIGTFALLNRGDNSGELELATATEPTSTTVAVATPAQGAVDPAATAPPASLQNGPLTEMQQRLAGTSNGDPAVFCFVGTDPHAASRGRPDAVFLEITMANNGSASMLGISTTNILAGTSNGDNAGNLSFVVTDYTDNQGPFPQDVPFAMIMTDQDMTFSEEVRLTVTSCDSIAADLDLLRPALDIPRDDGDQAAVAPIDSTQVLSSAGLGPLRIGMTISELSTDLGTDISFDTIGLRQAGECGWVATTIDDDVWILVELTGPSDAIVRRVSVSSDRFATPSGIRVGMAEQQLYDAFAGQLETRPHVYVEDGNYITFQPSDVGDPNTVEFWTESGVVTQIHVGDRNWVSFIEGCA